MANPVAIQCSACLATLRVPEDKLGKKIRCPKCAEVFVAEAAEADDFEVEEEESQPRSRGKGPVKKGGKKSQGSGLLIAGIAGGVVALGAVIGLVIFLMGSGDDGPIAPAPHVAAAPAMPMPPAGAMAGHGGAALPPGAPQLAPAAAHGPAPAVAAVSPTAMGAGAIAPVAPTAATTVPEAMPVGAPAAEFVSHSSSGPAKIDLSWIPANTELVIHVRPAAIWAAPALQPALKNPMVTLAMGPLQAMTGLTVADIESLTLATRSPPIAVMPAAGGTSPTPEQLQHLPNAEMIQPVLVARLKQPIFESVWERPDFQLQTRQYAGQTVRTFTVPGPDGKLISIGIYQPNELTIVAGLQDVVQQLIDIKGEARLFGDWAPLDPNLQIQIGGRVNGLSQMIQNSAQLRTTATTPAQQRADRAMQQHFRSAVGGLQITDGLELLARVQADSEAGVKELAEAVQATQSDSHPDIAGQVEKAVGALPEEAKALLQTLQEQYRQETSGTVTTYTTRIPADKLGLLVQLAQKSQQGQMAGMLLGGPPGMSPGGMGPGMGLTPGERTGQTDPMPTKNAEALPKDLELQASTLWDAPNLENGTVPLLIQFHLTTTDDSLLCAAGEFEFRPPTTDAGKILANLPPRQTTLAGGEQILRTYVAPLDPDTDDPKSLKFHIAFRSPAEARELRVCEGKFKVTRAGARTEVQLPLKKPIPAKLELSQELQKAGLSVKLERTKSGSHAGSEELVVSTGTSAVVGQLQILADADGDAPAGWQTPVVKFVRDKAGMAQRLSSVDGEDLPSEFVLKFVLYTDTETVDVPFDFAGLELPAAIIQPMTGAAPGFPGGSLPPGAFPGAPPQPPAGFPGSPAGPALPAPPEGRPVPRQN